MKFKVVSHTELSTQYQIILKPNILGRKIQSTNLITLAISLSTILVSLIVDLVIGPKLKTKCRYMIILLLNKIYASQVSYLSSNSFILMIYFARKCSEQCRSFGFLWKFFEIQKFSGILQKVECEVSIKFGPMDQPLWC